MNYTESFKMSEHVLLPNDKLLFKNNTYITRVALQVLNSISAMPASKCALWATSPGENILYNTFP